MARELRREWAALHRVPGVVRRTAPEPVFRTGPERHMAVRPARRRGLERAALRKGMERAELRREPERAALRRVRRQVAHHRVRVERRTDWAERHTARQAHPAAADLAEASVPGSKGRRAL